MKNKILIIAVIALMLINVVLIAFLWTRNFKQPRHPQMPTVKGPAFEYLSKELGLTPDQQKRYEALRNTHLQLTQQVGNEQRLQRDSFFDKLKYPKADPAEVTALEQRILSNQQKLDTATFYHFRRLREMLSPAQQTKFDSVIRIALHMMTQRPEGQRHNEGPPRDPLPPKDKRGNLRPENGRPDPEKRPHDIPYSPDGRPMPPPPHGQGPPPGGPPPPPPGGPPPNGEPPLLMN